MRRRQVIAGIVLVASMVLAAAAVRVEAGPGPRVNVGPRVTDAWIRWLPGNIPSGGYLTVINPGDTAVSLTGAGSDDYGSISLHRSREQGGVSSMTPVTAIDVKPHSTLVFADEGYHLMLLQPKKPLEAGDTVIITLRFSNGMSIPTPFRLRSPDMLLNK